MVDEQSNSGAKVQKLNDANIISKYVANFGLYENHVYWPDCMPFISVIIVMSLEIYSLIQIIYSFIQFWLNLYTEYEPIRIGFDQDLFAFNKDSQGERGR